MAQELDTPISTYLRATYDLPLPARFYDSKTLKPFVISSSATALVALYEKGESNLSADDIAAAFIIQNVPSGTVQRRTLVTLVDSLKTYGLELSTRFGDETRYTNYSVAQLEVDRDSIESTIRAQKNYEKLLSKGIDEINQKIAEYPVADLTRAEVQQSNLVFTKISWNADNVDTSLIRSRDTSIQPIIDKAKLTNEDAPDIFRLIPVSSDFGGIPYLGYHTPLGDQYRVTTTPQIEGATTKIIAVHPAEDEYTFGAISKSKLYSDLRRSTSFLSFMFRGLFGLLDLSHSTLILNRVSKESEEDLTSQIQELLPFLRIEGLSHRKITARVLSPIGGAIAYHVLFFDAFLNQSEYVGFKEEEDPQLLKPIKTIYLSPIPRVVNPLTDEFATVGEVYIVMTNRTSANAELVTLDRSRTTYELARGSSYVEFMLYDISNTAILNFTMAYLSRMVGHYYDVAVAQYGSYITEQFNLPISGSSDVSSDAVYTKASSNIRSIDFMSHTYPEVFGHNFTRLCPHYPSVKATLDPDDTEYQPGEDQTGGRDEWLKFPPDGGIEFYFRCDREDGLHYPGIVVSKLRNRAKYPLLPCCFRGNQFREGMRTSVAYKIGAAKASSVSAMDITVSSWGQLNYPPSFNKRLLMVSEKTLHRGRMGRIPEALMSVIVTHILPSGTGVCPSFDSRSQDSDEVDEEEGDIGDRGRRILRLGLSEPNMIHACYLAVDPRYQKLSTASASDRLDYLRASIGANLPDPACLYQELPAGNATADALMREDESHSLFSSWTSATHYRILEEILNINLYVIIRITPRENTIEPNRYYFEIPSTRSGAPHMRRHSRIRPSVLLYRVRRFEGDFIADSGLELILHGTRFTAFSGVWGTACSTKIAELYNRSAQVLSFVMSPIDPSLYVACTGLNTADYASVLVDLEPKTQLIDEKGLCRALNYNNFSIVFPATQPYNLPFSPTLKKSAYEPEVTKIFGDSCLTSMVRDGVFYTLGEDSTRYIFVPLQEGDDTLPSDMPKAAYTPLTGLSLTAVDYGVQWRTAYTYLRIILFMIAFLYTFAEPRDPAVFMQKYVIIDETRHKSQVSQVYDFSSLKRTILLREAVFSEALNAIKKLAPSLLDEKGEKIVVTSQKIFDGLAYYIRTVHDQTIATPLAQLRKKRWDLARVIAPSREGGGPATQLLNPRKDRESTTLDFGSARSVRMWFRSLRSGATSGAMTTSSSSRAVFDTIKSRSGIILFRHPYTGRVWLIPGITDYLRNITVVCYLWIKYHRVMELESQVETIAAVDRLNVQSGLRAPRTSRITAMFRAERRSRSRRTGRVLDEDQENLSALKHLVDSENIKINTYVITRDNNIELLLEDNPPVERTVDSSAPLIIIEVLRSGPDRFTPMLSP